MAKFAEPLLFMGSFFMWAFFAISVIGCWLLRKFETWLPDLHMIGRFLIVFVLVALIDFAMESLFTHTGIFAYVAVYQQLSLWAGTAAQFPLYESTGIAAVATGLTILRYFRDDQGQSFVEKGVQKFAVPAPARRFLSFLALVGAIQLIVLVGFEGITNGSRSTRTVLQNIPRTSCWIFAARARCMPVRRTSRLSDRGVFNSLGPRANVFLLLFFQKKKFLLAFT